MDNNVCKIGPFLPFQGCVTYSNTNIMSNNVNATTTATIVSATFSHGVQRFQRCCIQSETSPQPKLPRANSLSMCEASDSLATTYHLYIVEAVRTEGSSPPKNGRQRQKEWNGGIKKENWTV